LSGFDGSKHTPVEILHVFLLGMVNYLFRDFMNHLKPNEKQELIGLWQLFTTNSLNIPLVKPIGLVQYASSLVGQDFKTIIQAAPFIFFDSWILQKQPYGILSVILSAYVMPRTKFF
jgi:hypothetical protein